MDGRQIGVQSVLNKAFSLLMSIVLVWGCCVPSSAYATDLQGSSTEDESIARAPGMGRF